MFYCQLKTQVFLRSVKLNTSTIFALFFSIFYTHVYICIYLLQSRYYNNVWFFFKLLKTHFFVIQIFRSHFGSFFCIEVTLIVGVLSCSVWHVLCRNNWIKVLRRLWYWYCVDTAKFSIVISFLKSHQT